LLYRQSISINEFSSVYQGASINDDASIYIKDSLNLKTKDFISGKYSQLILKRINSNRVNNPSYIFQKIKVHFSDLTNGLSISEITKLIEKSKVYNEGLEFSDYLELSFSENKKIYFELNTDTPTQIIYIWLSDGNSLYSIISNEPNPQKLLLAGAINDKDGYSNIRERPSKNAKIIDRFTDKEYFYYIPNSSSDWWQVSRKDNLKCIIGYMHRSKIFNYYEMPGILKTKVLKDRKGY